MKIVPLGAAGGEVTGSAYLVQTPQARVLVDCGLFQGGKAVEALNRPPAGLPVAALDAVLVTHGHLDHVGRLPLLAKAGYCGPIFATPASVEMAALILRDSAKIQLQDAERSNRKRQRAGLPPKDPLYSPDNAEAAIALLKPAPYQEPLPVAPGVIAVWAEAGHMLGSASIQLQIAEGTGVRRVVFSGDLGPHGAPILRDAEPFREADLVFLESTYGDRDHQPFSNTVDEFVAIVRESVEQRGKILVPTFAVGRAQLLTVLLSWMFRERKVPSFPVFLDSPMAAEAWKIYARHTELFDDEMLAFLRAGSIEADLRTMRTTVSADESRALNDQPGPCLIMAGAGMCNAGRIQHHLRQNLWKPETHVVIVGYQGEGTLGRQLVDRAKSVKIHGEKVAVKARIHTLGGFSAHAGQTDLLAWFSAMSGARPRVALIHGEEKPRLALAQQLQERYALAPLLPALGDSIEP
jgi:metallo-beta-lactamase family protein